MLFTMLTCQYPVSSGIMLFTMLTCQYPVSLCATLSVLYVVHSILPCASCICYVQ